MSPGWRGGGMESSGVGAAISASAPLTLVLPLTYSALPVSGARILSATSPGCVTGHPSGTAECALTGSSPDMSTAPVEGVHGGGEEARACGQGACTCPWEESGVAGTTTTIGSGGCIGGGGGAGYAGGAIVVAVNPLLLSHLCSHSANLSSSSSIRLSAPCCWSSRYLSPTSTHVYCCSACSRAWTRSSKATIRALSPRLSASSCSCRVGCWGTSSNCFSVFSLARVVDTRKATYLYLSPSYQDPSAAWQLGAMPSTLCHSLPPHPHYRPRVRSPWHSVASLPGPANTLSSFLHTEHTPKPFFASHTSSHSSRKARRGGCSIFPCPVGFSAWTPPPLDA